MIFLVDGNAILQLVIFIYLICHSPAIIMLIIGLYQLKKKQQRAKKLLIFSGIYFLIGTGICGAILTS